MEEIEELLDYIDSCNYIDFAGYMYDNMSILRRKMRKGESFVPQLADMLSHVKENIHVFFVREDERCEVINRIEKLLTVEPF